MQFKMWTWYHFAYILSPFVVAAVLWCIFRNKSQRAKYTVAVIFAVLNVANLLLRNIDIFVRDGFDAELIPLGPCHFANFLFLIAVFTKKQFWYNISWCLNLPFGFLAIVFANSLENYTTLSEIRPQTYIWGHMFLVASILYVFLIGFTQFDKKSFKKALAAGGIWLGVCVVVNIVFNSLTKGSYGFANYMYLVQPESGTPLGIIFIAVTNFEFLGTTINPVYIILLTIVGLAVFFLFYLLHNFLRRLKKTNAV